MRPKLLLVIPALLSLKVASAQSLPKYLQPILSEQIQPPTLVEYEIRHLLMTRVPKLPSPTSAEQWTAEARNLREHLLNDIVYHGWPQSWVAAPPHFEDLALIESGKGYRLRKLRYEIVPGFESTAILYEPEDMTGEMPAIVSVNGHVGPEGKAIEYQQKLCINYAKRGILTLSLEWFGYGELSQPENGHDFAAHLDLVGANAIGLFYLAIRRGLDYLYNQPHVDRNRLGVTGLSGGGWQTIVLSALDERVTVSVPVAGYGSLRSNIWHPGDTGEIEEDATDFRDGQDYTTLTAMRAPRPTLLIYNAEDDCCFQAAFVRQEIYDDIRPFFRLFGKEDALAWHENTDPGTHNYQLDNRQHSYEFFDKYFKLSASEREIPADTEIKSFDELAVGLPNNLTVLGLAKKLAEGIRREPVPSGRSQIAAWFALQRAKLEKVVRYHPVQVESAWSINSTKNKGVETLSYRYELNNGLSATGVWLKAIVTPDNAPATIVLNDEGKKATAQEVSNRINRGEQVVALDLLFTGDETPEKPSPADYAPSEYALLLASTGDRPIGLQAAQLIALAHSLGKSSGTHKVRLEITGMRSQVVALIASAIEPELFSEVVIRHGIKSLVYLLDAPIEYRKAPTLFCLDLYKEFDLDRLAALAAPTKVMYGDEPGSPLKQDPK